MPGPATRRELVDGVERAAARLEAAVDELGEGVADAVCVDDWTVRDLFAVRLWWARSTCAWIEAGLRGEQPELPAPGYGWRETPALNEAIVRRAQRRVLPGLRRDLRGAVARALELVADLTDEQLLEARAFAWAGAWPVSRWVAVNVTRGLQTARSLTLRAGRAQ